MSDRPWERFGPEYFFCKTKIQLDGYKTKYENSLKDLEAVKSKIKEYQLDIEDETAAFHNYYIWYGGWRGKKAERASDQRYDIYKDMKTYYNDIENLIGNINKGIKDVEFILLMISNALNSKV